ncbi:methyltransferase domain-containing protein [Nocardioides guangzhouensis]|uniref:Methyltransferase domain-containing protein n=1 Tax=Nocardioides guangzhouensis TaxID=2497878 RepID=A0A4Q4ZGG9_9ACTN|nr:methyltransferase domain-containing protein [Nocardioides guangzhouensis]RYP87233.1 methyltransferase domain-containing protein [Nocardioides guangzhouensis]
MTETFHLSSEQARTYDEVFVPALFAQWAPQLVSCARIRAGDDVLDVACGTGVVARAVADVVGAGGRVVGVDLNPAMLEVAGARSPDLEWRIGDAEDLPYREGEFAHALCQSALFFFPDPRRAVAEMARVVRRGGTVALQTYAGLDRQPAYGPFVDAVARLAGPEVRVLLGTYWSQGQLAGLCDLLVEAGLEVVETRSSLGTVSFPSADTLVRTEIAATPLVERIDPRAMDAVLVECRAVLAPFVRLDGGVDAPIRALMVAARKP